MVQSYGLLLHKTVFASLKPNAYLYLSYDIDIIKIRQTKKIHKGKQKNIRIENNKITYLIIQNPIEHLKNKNDQHTSSINTRSS